MHAMPPEWAAPDAGPGEHVLSATFVLAGEGRTQSLSTTALLRLAANGRPLPWPNGDTVKVQIEFDPVPGAVAHMANTALATEAGITSREMLWPACLTLDAVNTGRARLTPIALDRAERRRRERVTGIAWQTPQRVEITASTGQPQVEAST